MGKSKLLNKKGIIVSCLIMLLAVLCGVGVYFKYNSKADFEAKKEIYNNYDDSNYGNDEAEFAFEDEASIEKAIYEQYASEENLDVQNNNGVLSYTVNPTIKEQVKYVKSVFAIVNKKNSTIVDGDTEYLYIGGKADCQYDSESGKVECTPDFKWLLLNGQQPLAMYPYEKDDNKVLSPVYLPEKDEVSYIVITKNGDDYVVDGMLEDGKISAITEGTKLTPAYASYDMEIVDIKENGAKATELYDDKVYTYGTDFAITYGNLPNDTYVAGLNIIYAENNGIKYGYYTNGIELLYQNNKVVENLATGAEDSEYIYLKGVQYIKEMIKHNSNMSFKEIRSVMRHHSNNEIKGYIATKNYIKINTALRNDKMDTLEEEDKLTIEALDKATETNTLSYDTLLVRNVNIDYLTSVFKINAPNGKALNDEEFAKVRPEGKLQILDELKKFEGTELKDKAYLSSSLIPAANIMKSKAVRFIIKAPKGTKGYITLNCRESECVMPRNTALRIDEINYDEKNDKYMIEVTVVQ